MWKTDLMFLFDYLQVYLVKYLQKQRHMIAPITPITPIFDFDYCNEDYNYVYYSDKLFEKLDKIV
jgi:hypothetical protein